MRRLARIHPLYYLALALFVAAVVASALTAGPTEIARTASVYDAGPGGAAALRRFFDGVGLRTTTIQGDTFRVDPGEVGVLFVLAPSETVTPLDADNIRRFVTAGGTAVIAVEAGIVERALLDLFDIHAAGLVGPGTYDVAGVAFADPPVHAISVDRGVALSFGPGRARLIGAGGRSIAAIAPEGRGQLIVVGTVAPFLTGQLGEADNGRFALALAGASRGRAVAFDEYHHGLHPTSDVLVLLERTWPGRALVFGGVALFFYLVLSGKRLGPPLPLDPRPPRSSLDFIRGFAGLVRRSGHGEIARRRYRRGLHAGLARELGLEPDTPFERTVATLAAANPARAAGARALDDALARPLRDEELLRTVREIDRVLGVERQEGIA